MITTICICGAGTMGSGIAQTAAQAGFETVLLDTSVDVLSRARNSIKAQLNSLVQKNRITVNEAEAILSRIRFTSDMREGRGELIIEAIIEDLSAKTKLFRDLAGINNADTMFASNTSSLSVEAIATGSGLKERLVGIHFFNPAPVMKLVEVVKTSHTTHEKLQVIRDVLGKMGKTVVVCRDAPGFIVNRVARPYYIEALRMAEKDTNAIAGIDTIMEATGFRMGPFRLMDLIGNDINYAVSCSVYEQLDKPERLRPSLLQAQKVAEGKLGRKSGEGYYDYRNQG